MRCEEAFIETYKMDPEGVAFCPNRICPLGAHIDHQHGKINGIALDKGVRIAYSREEDGAVAVRSLSFLGAARFHVNEIPAEKTGDWADHIRGAALELGKKYQLRYGLSAMIEGDLPIGGLSSSAAVIIAFLSALASVNNIRLEPKETILMAQAAENKYVGVKCGVLDQSCEVLCRKDHLLYLDCSDDSYQLIPWNGPDFKIAIFFSGFQRSLARSAYNLRQDECKAAASALLTYAGIDPRDLNGAILRNVPETVFEEYKDKLPLTLRKRATHFFEEYNRAEAGAAAWENGDLGTYGRLIFESGLSSIENYECGSPELITLYDIMTETDGIYGGRFSGAGFKGSCMALIDSRRSEEVLAHVEERYLSVYPELRGKYLSALCDSADGADLNGGLRV